MSLVRPSTSIAISILALSLLFGVAANAQATFSMTGKAATGSGAFVDLPAGGDVACPSVTGKIGFGPYPNMYPAPVTGVLIGPVPLNPGIAPDFKGCLPGGPAVVMTNGTGGFVMPPGFFKQTFPGGPGGGTPNDLNVTPVPNVPQILQLATSFKFEGPLAAPFSIFKAVDTDAPYAVWRQFKHNAYASQTGRLAKTFTACAAPPGMTPNIDCTFPSSGLVPGIVKNIGGAAKGFGGTMGLVLTTSPTQSSSLAIARPDLGAMGVAFVLVGGMGSRAAGRGYAAYDTDNLPGGMQFMTFALTTVETMVSKRVIKSVAGPLGTGPTATNMNWGFPWTTGDIIVRGTGGNGFGGPVNATITAMGTDKATTMIGLSNGMGSVMVPGGRLLQLVAGGVAQSTIQGPNGTPNYSVMRLPEPGGVLQLFAGVAGLIAVAVWRTRKAR